MSRINGHYKQDGHTSITELRVLDTATGDLFDEHGRKCHSGLTANNDGTWSRHGYTWVPDAVATVDWYLWCFNPNHTVNKYFTDGPYTEQGARSKAQDNAAKYPKNTYAVYRILQGNTVKVVPPTPPQPEVIWS